MLADQQTQRLPAETSAFASFRQILRPWRRGKIFRRRSPRRLRAVEKHYALLFEHAPGARLPAPAASSSPAPRTTRKRWRRCAKWGSAIPPGGGNGARLAFRRRPAVRSARAREVLTELVPAPARSLFANRATPTRRSRPSTPPWRACPAAVELFSLLKSNEAHAGIVRRHFRRRAATRAKSWRRRPTCSMRQSTRRLAAIVGSTRTDILRRSPASMPEVAASRIFSTSPATFAAEEKFLIGLRLFAA